jgi:hypothetical protein
MTTEPTQLLPKVTAPLVIVKFGDEVVGKPVVHRNVPFGLNVSTVNPFHRSGVPVLVKPVAVDVM